MSKVVRAAANLLFPFILIFGLYIVAHGHLTPGGGFQGGAVFATGIILMIVAYRYETAVGRFSKDILRNCEFAGLLIFVSLALAALAFGTGFFYNWVADTGLIFGASVAPGANPGDLNTGGVIPLMNLAVGLEVLGALSVIILYMLSGTREEA